MPCTTWAANGGGPLYVPLLACVPAQPKIKGPKDVSHSDRCDEVQPPRYSGSQEPFKDF